MPINMAHQSHIARDVSCRPTSKSDTDAAYRPWRQPLVLERFWPHLDKESLSPEWQSTSKRENTVVSHQASGYKNTHSCKPDRRVSCIVGNRQN